MAKIPEVLITTDYIAIYLAGLFDGNGSIQAYNTPKDGKSHYQLAIYISSNCTNPKYLRDLQEKIYLGNINTQNVWVFNGKDAEAILERLKPFSIAKKELIELALKFRATFNINFPKKKGIPSEITQQREDLIRRINEYKNENVTRR